MKTLKKSLCLILALVFVLGLCTIGAGAANFTDEKEINYKDAVTVMQGLGILVGYPDGSFQPAKTVTRAEAAKMIAYMMLGEKYAEKLAAGSAFADVPESHWASKYVNYCASKGIIVGYGDGNYGPSDPVTGIQMAKMLLVAVGYGEMGEFTGSNWDVNAFSDAVEVGIFTDAETEDFEAPATREETALYVFNTLVGVDQMKWDVDQNKYQFYKAPFGETVWNLDVLKGIVIANHATGADYTEIALPTYTTAGAFDGYDYAHPAYFNVETGTEVIGHQVEMYYDYSAKKDADKNVYYDAYLADDISTVVPVDTTKTLGELAASIGYVDTPFEEVDFYENYILSEDNLAEYLTNSNYSLYWTNLDTNEINYNLTKNNNVVSWTQSDFGGYFNSFDWTTFQFDASYLKNVPVKQANGSSDFASMFFSKVSELVLDEDGEIISALTSDYAIGQVTAIDDEEVAINVFGATEADDEEEVFDLADCYEGIAVDDYVTIDWVGSNYTIAATFSTAAEITETNVELATLGWYSFNNSTIWSMAKNSRLYGMDGEVAMGAITVGSTIEFIYDSHFNAFAAVVVEGGAISYAFITKTYSTDSTSYGDIYRSFKAQAVDSEGNEVNFTYDQGMVYAGSLDTASLKTNFAAPAENTLVKVITLSNGYTQFVDAATATEIKNVSGIYEGTESKIKETRHYMTDATKYIYVNENGAKLDVAFGDVLKTVAGAQVWYTAAEEGVNINTIWVYGAPAATKQSSDIIYVKGDGDIYTFGDDTSVTKKSGTIDLGNDETVNYFTVYVNGVKTSGVKVDAEVLVEGFYTYSIDTDGIYTLSAVASTNYEVKKVDDADAIYRGKLLIADSAVMDDYDLSEATIIDLSKGYIDAKGYSKAVDSASAMAAALKQGYTFTLAYMIDTVNKVPTGALYVIDCAKPAP